jgi:hypothetical protein
MEIERDWGRDDDFEGFASSKSPPLRVCALRNFCRSRPDATGLRRGFATLSFFMKSRSPPRESQREHSPRRALIQRPLWMPKN